VQAAKKLLKSFALANLKKVRETEKMNLSVFHVKLGHFIINEIFPLCNKHTSLTAKIENEEKKVL